jgi:hypothetical protein
VSRDNFEWIGDTDGLNRFEPPRWTRRFFCVTYGSFLLTEHDAEPENVSISLGCLDNDFPGPIECHQFVADSPGWLQFSESDTCLTEWAEAGTEP